MSSLTDYINQARQSSMSDEQITQALLSSGWPKQDIKTALGAGVNLPPTTSWKPDRKAFLKKWLSIIIAFIIIVGGGFGAFELFIRPSVVLLNSPEALDIVVNENRDAKRTEAQDCGSIRSVETRNERESFGFLLSLLSLSYQPFSEEQENAAICMDSAIETCKPARLAFITDVGSAKIEVLGKEGSDCVMSQEFYTTVGGTAVCKIPTHLINSIGQKIKLEKEKAKDITQSLLPQSIPSINNPNANLSLGILGITSLLTFAGPAAFLDKDSSEGIDCVVPKPIVDLKVNYGQTVNSDGPINVDNSTSSIDLHWSSIFSQNCTAFGSWSGSHSYGGLLSLSGLYSSSAQEIFPTDAARGEYTFGLACFNKSGFTSDEVKVYFPQ